MVGRWVQAAVLVALAACSGGTPASNGSVATVRDTVVPVATTSNSATTTAPNQAPTTVAVPEGWSPDLSSCADPAAAAAPLSAPLRVAAFAPLAGLPGAAAAPVVHALEVGLAALAPDIQFTVLEDPIDPQARALAAVEADVDLFVGIVGSEASATIADALADRCVPQLFSLGDAARLDDPQGQPWTSTAVVPARLEAVAFMNDLAANNALLEDAPGSVRVGVFLTNADSADATEAALQEAAASAAVSIERVVRVEPFDGLGVIAAARQIYEADVDSVVLASSGLDCISFLQAWDEVVGEPTEADPEGPAVFLAGACAARAVFRGAQAAADGVLSGAVYVDVFDPAVAAIDEVAQYLSAMSAAGYENEAGFGVAGWVIAEATAAAVRQAAASPSGLSRVTIMEAARSLTLQSALLQPEITVATNGVADPFFFDAVRLVRYDASADAFATT
jgi:branched-chain amino acid transport system substrate-binding protein